MVIVLHDLRSRLRRRADQVVATALVIVAKRIEGYEIPEIRQQLNVPDDEFDRALEWAQDDLSALHNAA